MSIRILEDLGKLGKLDEAKVDSFIEHINNNPMNTPGDTLLFHKWCNDNSIDIKDGNGILNFIYLASSFISEKRNYKLGLDELMKLLFRDGNIPEEYISSWQKLSDTLPKLDRYSIELKKSEIINRSKRLSDIRLTCDVRPIFDLERKNIVDYTYPILLTLRELRSEEILNYELTEKELNELSTELSFAIDKIKILKEKIENKTK